MYPAIATSPYKEVYGSRTGLVNVPLGREITNCNELVVVYATWMRALWRHKKKKQRNYNKETKGVDDVVK